MSKAELRRYCDVLTVVDMLKNEHISLLNPKTWADQNDSHLIELFEQKLDDKKVFAYCLTAAKETYHHWQVFSGHPFGCCIVFDRKKFLGQCDEHPSIRHASVEYMNISQLRKIESDDSDRLPFIKRKVFEDEDEYRVLAIDENMWADSVFNIPIDLSCIKRIVFSPLAPRDPVISMKEIIEESVNCSHIEFRHSTLTNNKVWREYAERELRTPS